MHLHALGQQVSRRFVTDFFQQREQPASGAHHRFLTFDQLLDHVGGHALTDGWDRAFKKNAGDLYEKLAQTFEFDAWICGRVTMQEIAHDEGYPTGLATAPLPRTHHFAERNAKTYAISIDPHGKVGWKKSEALDSHIVEVLTEGVTDDYLAYLQSIACRTSSPAKPRSIWRRWSTF